MLLFVEIEPPHLFTTNCTFSPNQTYFVNILEPSPPIIFFQQPPTMFPSFLSNHSHTQQTLSRSCRRHGAPNLVTASFNPVQCCPHPNTDQPPAHVVPLPSAPKSPSLILHHLSSSSFHGPMQLISWLIEGDWSFLIKFLGVLSDIYLFNSGLSIKCFSVHIVLDRLV